MWQEKESKSPILFHNKKTMDESQIAMPTRPKKPSTKASHSTIKKRDNWPKQCTHGISMKQPNLYPLFLGRFFRDFPPGVREIQLSPENSTVKSRFYPSSCHKFLPKQHPIPRRVHDLGKLSQPHGDCWEITKFVKGRYIGHLPVKWSDGSTVNN